MKKVLLVVTVGLLSLAGNAQMMLGTDGGTLSFRKSPEFNDENIAGSRYLTEDYQLAKVNKGSQDFMIRYNAYNDMMEYKNGADVLELIKDKNTHFRFFDGKIFELFSYDLDGKNHTRYHQVLFDDNGIKISKYISFKLIPAQKATNSYERDTQAAYKANKEMYFITYNNRTVEFDGKQKNLEKIVTGKSDVIKKFYKENKIRENDADMIKLGQFLSKL